MPTYLSDTYLTYEVCTEITILCNSLPTPSPINSPRRHCRLQLPSTHSALAQASQLQRANAKWQTLPTAHGTCMSQFRHWGMHNAEKDGEVDLHLGPVHTKTPMMEKIQVIGWKAIVHVGGKSVVHGLQQQKVGACPGPSVSPPCGGRGRYALRRT